MSKDEEDAAKLRSRIDSSLNGMEKSLEEGNLFEAGEEYSLIRFAISTLPSPKFESEEWDWLCQALDRCEEVRKKAVAMKPRLSPKRQEEILEEIREERKKNKDFDPQTWLKNDPGIRPPNKE